MKTIEQAASEWANDHCGINDSIEVSNKDINLYFRSAFDAGVGFAQRWISVEEGLPEDREDILIKRGEKYVIVAGYYVEEYKAFYFPYSFSPLTNVTHWRPIELK
jgi:hypothetical protein